jgi:hypothetical protein
MLFHLVNGTHKLGAVYFPAIRNSSIEQLWMKKIDYIVAWNKPLLEVAEEKKRHTTDLRLADIKSITYESEIFADMGNMKILVSNPGKRFSLDMVVRFPMPNGYTERSFKLDVPAEYEGPVCCPISKVMGLSSKWLKLLPLNANNRAILLGLGFSNESSSVRWPWEQRAKIAVEYKDSSQVSATFDVFDTLGSKELRSYYENDPESLRVMSDRGSTVVLRKINRDVL